jgi:hypothetical protein
MEQGSLVTGAAAAPRTQAVASRWPAVSYTVDRQNRIKGTQTISHVVAVIQRPMFVRYHSWVLFKLGNVVRDEFILSLIQYIQDMARFSAMVQLSVTLHLRRAFRSM